MKPSHMKTPRTIDEGHFTRGYTTEPVGRKSTPKWLSTLGNALFAVLLGLVIFLIFGPELLK